MVRVRVVIQLNRWSNREVYPNLRADCRYACFDLVKFWHNSLTIISYFCYFQEHRGDLNQAMNAYFNEGDRIAYCHPHPSPQYDFIF